MFKPLLVFKEGIPETQVPLILIPLLYMDGIQYRFLLYCLTQWSVKEIYRTLH